ncbi:MAG: hypothetical protein M0Z38_02315 [Deltaproteobacteria bacterium]|nr:hypothetical protein [Deltaproteobacteria bacterium]
MTPLDEYRSLVARSHAMIDGILMLILSALHLAVAAVTLFCVVWISIFTTGRTLLDRQAARIKVPREAT